MDITWKYKIEVKDPDIFNKIEKTQGVKFPEELKDFILKNNGATPSKYNFMLGADEKVLGAVLSFNENEKDTDNLMPFAIDPFGNYICYTLNSKEIVFWDHENNITESTHKGLESFLESLY